MRRTALAAATAAGTALLLTGCFIHPPAIPDPTTMTTASPSQTTSPSQSPAPSPSAAPATPDASGIPEDGFAPIAFHYDDDGEVWDFSLTGMEGPAPDEEQPAPGQQIIVLVLDGTHVAGEYSFYQSVDAVIQGSDGVEYSYYDTFVDLTLSHDHDIYYAGNIPAGESFTGARMAVVLPEGVQPETIQFVDHSQGTPIPPV